MPSPRPAVSRIFQRSRRFLARLLPATLRVVARGASQAALLASALVLFPTAAPAEGAPAGVTISPKGTTINRAYGITEETTFDVTNTGTASASITVTWTCSGAITCSPSPLTTTLAAGQVWHPTVSWFDNQVGTGTLTVTASTSGASDQAVTTVQVYAPGVTVSPTSTSVTQPPTSAQSGTFTVSNTGGGRLYYTTGVTCTGALTGCSVSPTGFYLDAGVQRTVTASYTTGAAGTTGAFAFTAYTTGANAGGAINVTAASATTAVSVTPKNGTTTLGPTTSGNTFTFTVQNTGTATTTFTLTGSCASAVTCSAYSNSVSLAAGASTTVPITYATAANNTGANLTGTVKLKAAAGAVADSATYTVTVTPTPPAVAVTPKTSTTSLPVNTTGQSFTFTVANTSTSTAATSFTLTGTCAGSVSCTAYSNTASLAGGQQTTVPLTFATTGTAGTGTIKLTAAGGGVSDSATYTVTVTAATAGVTVTPKGQTVTWPSWTFPTQSYTVTNTGSASATFTIVKSCGGAFVTCTAQGGTTSQTIAAGASATIGFTYETHGPPPGTGWVRLKASSGSVADSATTNVNAVAPGGSVAISPSSVTKPASSAQSSTFTVTNSGTATSTYTLSVACTAPLTACSVPAPTSVTLAGGASASVPVTYTTGAAGSSGTITLTAATPNITPNATLTVNAVATSVAVSPNSASPLSWPPGSTQTVTFTVKNTGTLATTFDVTVSCTNPVTCANSTSPLMLASGAQSDVSVNYTMGPSSTAGYVMATAAANGVSVTGQILVSSIGVSIEPESLVVVPLGDGQPVTQQFDVRNTSMSGTPPVTFTLTGSCSGDVSCSNSPTTISLLGGTQTSVPFTYTPATSGTSGTAQLVISGGGVSDTGKLAIYLARLEVTPKNSVTTLPPSTTGNSITFNVKNTGGAAQRTWVITTCSGPITCSGGSALQILRTGDVLSVPVTFVKFTRFSRHLV